MDDDKSLSTLVEKLSVEQAIIGAQVDCLEFAIEEIVKHILTPEQSKVFLHHYFDTLKSRTDELLSSLYGLTLQEHVTKRRAQLFFSIQDQKRRIDCEFD